MTDWTEWTHDWNANRQCLHTSLQQLCDNASDTGDTDTASDTEKNRVTPE